MFSKPLKVRYFQPIIALSSLTSSVGMCNAELTSNYIRRIFFFHLHVKKLLKNLEPTAVIRTNFQLFLAFRMTGSLL